VFFFFWLFYLVTWRRKNNMQVLRQILILFTLAHFALATYSTYSIIQPAGSSAAYSTGSTMTINPEAHVAFPHGATTTFPQATTITFKKATTMNGTTYPAGTNISFHADATPSWASGSVIWTIHTTRMDFGSYNGNTCTIVTFPSITPVQVVSSSAPVYFAPGTPSSDLQCP
jgi:hypothetical protein